ncbi:MAG TPA: 50S ribosomal protein L21 [Acidimicrobiales bacterium]|nr:50S ribosomal protein L21 [Acidimicrobiales bacterium]
MYAVIKTGGKQYRVSEGQRLEVERVAADGGELSFEPLMLVDGRAVTAGTGALTGAKVTARVVGESQGPKVVGFKYKNKSNQRRHWGHRQRYTTIEITGITGPGSQEG